MGGVIIIHQVGGHRILYRIPWKITCQFGSSGKGLVIVFAKDGGCERVLVLNLFL